MTIRVAVGTIAACTVMLAGIGGGIGWALGTFAPGYYRSVFRNGNEPWFDVVSVGIGQGLSQGTAGGVVVGVVLVALFVWRDTRARRQSGPPSIPGAGDSDASEPPVGRYLGGLFAPWLILGGGIAGLVAVPDPEAAFGLWYLLLIVCMRSILGLLAVGVWSLIRSAPRRRSAWAWGFLVGCFINMILLSKVGGH
jgi:hypothetical protein